MLPMSPPEHARADDKAFLAEITEPKHQIKDVRFYKPSGGVGVDNIITVSAHAVHISGEITAGIAIGEMYKIGGGMYNG